MALLVNRILNVSFESYKGAYGKRRRKKPKHLTQGISESPHPPRSTLIPPPRDEDGAGRPYSVVVNCPKQSPYPTVAAMLVVVLITSAVQLLIHRMWPWQSSQDEDETATPPTSEEPNLPGAQPSAGDIV